jgi:multimeric flavodoxin WrbA
MRATIINCTLKTSPETSNTEALASVVVDALKEHDVETEMIRALDYEIKPGTETDMGTGDQWPEIHEKLLASEILVIATPTWFGQPSSVSKRVLERMNGMLSETDDSERPVAYNRVAGVVVTGNEDGAHHVISEISGALVDIGYTIPGQAWTYWNKGPGPGDEYLEADDEEGKQWSHTTGRAAAQNLVAVATALAANEMKAPPNE